MICFLKEKILVWLIFFIAYLFYILLISVVFMISFYLLSLAYFTDIFDCLSEKALKYLGK